MPKKKSTVIENRNYDLPDFFPIIVLSGDIWRISDIPSGVLHFHNCIEIGICESDSGFLELRNATYPFHKGDITIIGSDVCHTTYSSVGTSSKWSYIFIDFEELLSPYLPLSLFTDKTSFNNLIHSSFMILHSSECMQIKTYIEEIIYAYKNETPNFQFSIRGLALSLLITLLNMNDSDVFSGQMNKDLKKGAQLVITPALDYIRNNYMNNFNINTLADICHLSPTHFRRTFTETMGTNPLDYLNKLRIEKASFLLRSTELPVIDISAEVGFQSVSSFNRHFQEEIGTSPLKWRNQVSFIKNKSVMKYTGWLIPPSQTKE